MIEEAIDVIMESRQASTSMLQRRLKLGYSRAARIIDQIEERGIIGPFEGSKPAPDPHFARGMAGNEAEKKYADRIKQTNKTQQFIYGGFYHEEDQYRRAVL